MKILLLELAFIFLILLPLMVAVALMFIRRLRLKKEVISLRNTIVTVESQNVLKHFRIMSVSNFVDFYTPYSVQALDLQTLEMFGFFCYDKGQLLYSLQIR